MKKILFSCAVLVLFFSVFTLFAMSGSPKMNPSFEGSPAWQKLDLRLKEAWRVSLKDKSPKNLFECMMKTKNTMSDDERKILGAAGFSSRTVTGKIVTGSVLARDLQPVAELEFVELIELAVPMSLKKKK